MAELLEATFQLLCDACKGQKYFTHILHIIHIECRLIFLFPFCSLCGSLWELGSLHLMPDI